jgi:hypothetical protein
MVVVCRHLLTGEFDRWVEVPNPDEDQSDWLCPKCFRKGPERIPLTDLAAVCMHCAREMREAVR